MFLLSNFEVHSRTQSLTCCLFFMTDRFHLSQPSSYPIIEKKKDGGTIIPSFHFTPFGFIKIGQQPEGPQLLLGSQTISLSFFFLVFFPLPFFSLKQALTGVCGCMFVFHYTASSCLPSQGPYALHSRPIKKAA